MTSQSTLATLASAASDHRIVFKVAVLCLAIVLLRLWGSEDVRRAIDYAASAGSDPARVVGRLSGAVGPAKRPRQAAGPAGEETTATSGLADPVVWFLVKGPDTLRAEVHDRGGAAVDFMIFKNGQLWRRERWTDRTRARVAANLKRTELEQLGWARPSRSP